MVELRQVDSGQTRDIYYVDTHMFDSEGYGAVYIVDDNRPAIVDSGTGHRYQALLAGLEAAGIAPDELEAIVLTHVHLDHAGGASPLIEACPNANVYVYEAGAKFLRDPSKLWEGTKAVVGDRIRYYREPDPIPDDRLIPIEDGDVVDLGAHELVAHHAPGHAFHQVVYHDLAADGVFCADAAGINVPGVEGVLPTSPPPTFDLEGCLADVEMIEELDPAALFYPHFGDRETGPLLSTYATVISEWVDAVVTKRDELGDDDAVIRHFQEQSGVDAWTTEHNRGEVRMNVQGVLRYLDSS